MLVPPRAIWWLRFLTTNIPPVEYWYHLPEPPISRADMTTFTSIERLLGQVPGELTMLLREIDRAQGRQEAFRIQHPQRLDVLTRVARIESTEASNEIEGITAPHARIEALVAETTTPRNRSEEE